MAFPFYTFHFSSYLCNTYIQPSDVMKHAATKPRRGRKNTDGGCQPLAEMVIQTKPRRGDREFCHPFRVLVVRHPFTGVVTPAYVLSTLRGCAAARFHRLQRHENLNPRFRALLPESSATSAVPPRWSSCSGRPVRGFGCSSSRCSEASRPSLPPADAAGRCR